MPGIFSKKDAAASFPVDETTPFHPSKAIYIKEGTEFTLALTMTDVTTAVAALRSPVLETAALLEEAKSAACTLPITLKLTRPNRISRAWAAMAPTSSSGPGSSDTPVAEVSSPLWSLGKWTLKFPAGSPHSAHDILLHPAGFAARADEFVKDSVPYFWDMLEEDGRRLCKLYRARDGKKVEIARFVGKNVRARDGVLLLGAEEGKEGVDEVVVMLTLVGVLNRSESFRA